MRWWQQLKNVYHILQARAWSAYYGHPERALTIFGITGTNGKTTTSYLVAHILAAQYGRAAVGLLSTITFWIGETERVNRSKMTTLDSRILFKYLREMQQANVKYVVLEITSHALDQHRLGRLRLQGAIILNLSREHLDYHRTMPAYAAAKQRIVHYLDNRAPLIGKADDDWVRTILTDAHARGVPTIPFTAAESSAVATPLPGAVNKENVLAATLLSQHIGVSAAAITQGIAAVSVVPGRMEWLMSSDGRRVLVDYAVTPDALERLYRTVKATTTGKVYAILGAAGQRDRGKRPAMAAAAARFADELILTREDPWTESEEQIFNDLEKGLHDTTIPWQRIIDRRDALRYCLKRATPEDVIVITGKGAEEGMGIGKKIIPWNERAIITELLAETK